MNNDSSEIVEIILFASAAAFNFFFFYMWHILRGKWYSIDPACLWMQDIRELKKLSVSAVNAELRNKCRFVLNGIYFSSTIFFLGLLLDLIR